MTDMTAAEGILMRLVVTDPGATPPGCPWGLTAGATGTPCDGSTCPLCRSVALRTLRHGRG